MFSIYYYQISQIFQQYGIETAVERIDPLFRYAMACPALPTCGLAVTESERVIPSILQRIRQLLEKLNLSEHHFVVRMTGCPNGCARPYMAELGFVGSGPEAYQIWLGGSPNQTTLAQPYIEKLPIKELESFLEPILVFFRENRQNSESFGEFCHRVGFNAIRAFSANYQTAPTPSSRRSRKHQHRISVADDLYTRLKEKAAQQDTSMNRILAEALEAYFTEQ